MKKVITLIAVLLSALSATMTTVNVSFAVTGERCEKVISNGHESIHCVKLDAKGNVTVQKTVDGHTASLVSNNNSSVRTSVDNPYLVSERK